MELTCEIKSSYLNYKAVSTNQVKFQNAMFLGKRISDISSFRFKEKNQNELIMDWYIF